MAFPYEGSPTEKDPRLLARVFPQDELPLQSFPGVELVKRETWQNFLFERTHSLTPEEERMEKLLDRKSVV